MKNSRMTLIALLALISSTSSDATTEGSFFAIIVSDIEASQQWYASSFNLVPGPMVSASGRYSIVNLQKPGLFIELLELETAEARSEGYIRGPFKVGLLVNDLSDFVAGLPDTIPEPDVIHDTPNNLLLVQLRDPDGNIVQVMELLKSQAN